MQPTEPLSLKSKRRRPEAHRIEVCGSFGYKLQCEQHGGPKYESRDFFQSAKSECFDYEAEEVAEKLHLFCKRIVLKKVNEYIKEGTWV
jgi:hypothetical protein